MWAIVVSAVGLAVCAGGFGFAAINGSQQPLGLLSIVLAGIGFALSLGQSIQLRKERSFAYEEIRHVYSQIWGIDWWILRNPAEVTRKDPDALANHIRSMLHVVALSLKSNAYRYSTTEMRQISPFPEERLQAFARERVSDSPGEDGHEESIEA